MPMGMPISSVRLTLPLAPPACAPRAHEQAPGPRGDSFACAE